MTEICPKCGLPKDLCICDILEKEAQQQKIKIFTETRKFGKIVTIVEGINKESLEKVVKELKQRIGCGGTAKNGRIELQGEHKARVKQILANLGYDQNNIEII
jgi:translation initiation factor 1